MPAYFPLVQNFVENHGHLVTKDKLVLVFLNKNFKLRSASTKLWLHLDMNHIKILTH